MIICKTKTDLTQALSSINREKLSIGLVPTMGALHLGHASLVEKARKENQIVVVSVFVNPIQFNNAEDLKHYPRTMENDLKILEEKGCDIVFAPSPEEMYPQGEPLESYDFGLLEKVMEGKNRPGHFNGVGVIVGRLFSMVNPNKAYFGEKDFQQVSIIKDLVRQMKHGVEIVPCPIIRESDGLALSSRNALLTKENRKIAPIIYSILKESLSLSQNASLSEVKQFVERRIKKEKYLALEYFEIADEDSMQSIVNWKDAKEQVGCIVVKLGDVRLIDNIRYHKK